MCSETIDGFMCVCMWVFQQHNSIPFHVLYRQCVRVGVCVRVCVCVGATDLLCACLCILCTLCTRGRARRLARIFGGNFHIAWGHVGTVPTPGAVGAR